MYIHLFMSAIKQQLVTILRIALVMFGEFFFVIKKEAAMKITVVKCLREVVDV